MAVRGFFYNATDLNDTERTYNGEDMNQDKAPFYKEGVVYGHLQVTAEGGSMEVKVDGGPKTGYAYINMHTIHNTSVLPLTLSQASGTLPRIDRVVIRNDQTERRPSIFIKEGAFSSNPQAPELINNDAIQEKSLARIYIPAGAVEITQANITDERADETVCGFIASQFQDFDFNQFSAQFNAWFAQEKTSMEADHADFVEEYAEMTQAFMDDQAAAWNKWFEEKQTELSGDVAGKLQLQIDGLTTKVHNMAFKVRMEYLLETIQAAITVTLTNTTTGTVQTAEISESGIGFYITEAGDYTLETGMESVMAIPKAFSVDNVDLMHEMTVALREGTNMAYIGNYMGTYLLKESEE